MTRVSSSRIGERRNVFQAFLHTIIVPGIRLTFVFDENAFWDTGFDQAGRVAGIVERHVIGKIEP